MTPPLANHVPHLLLTYDQDKVKIAPRDVMLELRKGTPSIELNPSTGSQRGGSAGLPGGVIRLLWGSGCCNRAKISSSPNGCMKCSPKPRKPKRFTFHETISPSLNGGRVYASRPNSL